MAEQPYKRPPITEAVIEIRFGTPVDVEHVNRLGVAFASSYPHEQKIHEFGVAFGAVQNETMPVEISGQDGVKRTTHDLTQILLVWPAVFAVSQLAPYPGWEDFFTRFQRDWATWKKQGGYRKIIRVGVRYINRIDVPTSDGLIDQSHFLKIYPQYPDILAPVMGFGVQIRAPIQDIGCNATINTGAVPSPLLDHGSVLLDIDIANDSNPPQNDEGLFAFLIKVRDKKNSIFEACLTDRTRELFQS